MPAAHRLLAPYIGRRSRDAEALYLAGYIAETVRDFGAAIRFGERSLKQAEHPETLLLLARCRRALGETAAVVRLCDRAIEHAPGNRHAQSVKAGALEEDH
jgi:hypothetical protein